MPDPTRRNPARTRFILFSTLLLLTLSALYLSLPLSSSHRKSNLPSYAKSYKYPPEPHQHVLTAPPKRIAIIGAGASGSSAAWFMDRAAGVVADRLGVNKTRVVEEIVVFEKNDHVGGRTTTVYPHGDTALRPIELGGSIFVSANRHMNKAAKRFGLKVIDPDSADGGIGIWDGQTFLFQTGTSSSRYTNWLDSLRALKRYGPLSYIRTQRAIKALLAKFANLYDPAWLASHGPAKTVEEFAERVGLGREYTTRRGEEWARDAVGLGEKWVGEVMEAGTRANYASDMNEIHALGAAVSSATDGAKSIEGGNWRIFDAMLKESRATINLGTEVVDIVPLVDDSPDALPKFQVFTNDSNDHGVFDQIFYASPWFNSPKDKGLRGLQRHLKEPISYTKYIRLHVTLLSTTLSSPHPSFFNLPPTSPSLPNTILTSSLTSRSHTDGTIPPPTFQSITWHSPIHLTTPNASEYIVKIFSKSYLPDRTLRALLGGQEPGWLLRKEWDAYPALRPLTLYPPVEPVRGVQYLGAMERWVSTMETQSISAREAVGRVVGGWWGLGYGECEGGEEGWDWSCVE